MAAMSTRKDGELAKLAIRQHSLITSANAAVVGLTRNDVRFRTTAGSLEHVRRGVTRVAGAAPTWEQAVLAACLAAGDPVAGSDGTAMFVHAFLGVRRPPVIELSVPITRQPRLKG